MYTDRWRNMDPWMTFGNLFLSALLKAGAEQAESPRHHGVEEKKYAGEHTWAKMKKNMSGEKEE